MAESGGPPKLLRCEGTTPENIHPDATKSLEAAGYEVENRQAPGRRRTIEALQGVTVLGIRSGTR